MLSKFPPDGWRGMVRLTPGSTGHCGTEPGSGVRNSERAVRLPGKPSRPWPETHVRGSTSRWGRDLSGFVPATLLPPGVSSSAGRDGGLNVWQAVQGNRKNRGWGSRELSLSPNMTSGRPSSHLSFIVLTCKVRVKWMLPGWGGAVTRLRSSSSWPLRSPGDPRSR